MTIGIPDYTVQKDDDHDAVIPAAHSPSRFSGFVCAAGASPVEAVSGRSNHPRGLPVEGPGILAI